MKAMTLVLISFFISSSILGKPLGRDAVREFDGLHGKQSSGHSFCFLRQFSKWIQRCPNRALYLSSSVLICGFASSRLFSARLKRETTDGHRSTQICKGSRNGTRMRQMRPQCHVCPSAFMDFLISIERGAKTRAARA